MKKTMSTLALMLAVTLPLCLFTACSDDDDTDNGTKGSSKSGTINGHEYVDLGLSVKWATCNIGASSPSDYGDQFAWGEIETKSTYRADNSVTNGKEMNDIAGDATYDVARAKWGGTWRMPTKEEFEELVKKCTSYYDLLHENNGYTFIGSNGNSIFLPGSGYSFGSSLNLLKSQGYYWSSTPYGDDRNSGACGLYFRYGTCYRNWEYRYWGQSVRPVSE